MENLQVYCEYLYHSLFIPVYIYDHKELIASFPVQEMATVPPQIYLDNLWPVRKNATYTLTHFFSYYGCIKIAGSDNRIVLGPVNDLPYSREVLQEMRREFNAELMDPEAFADFFQLIPTQNLDTLVNLLLFVNYTINNEKLIKTDIIDDQGTFIDPAIDRKYAAEVFTAKEEDSLGNNYAIESEFLRYIESGNLQELQKFFDRARHTKVGIIANDTLRHYKNTLIVTITLVGRAAMRGGLSPIIVYPLSEVYMKQAERLNDIDSITSLMGQVQRDFANRVANAIAPLTSDHTLDQVIQYVRENTNKNMTVAAIAEYAGYSRPYLSRKFKKELGFDLSDFIMRCKLEEGKDLLAYSDKSLSQISNYLCFSSQSHFQKAFKQQYGLTPLAYRKSVISR